MFIPMDLCFSQFWKLLFAAGSSLCRDSKLVKVPNVSNYDLLSCCWIICINPAKAWETSRKRRQNKCKNQRTGRGPWSPLSSEQDYWAHELRAAVVIWVKTGTRSRQSPSAMNGEQAPQTPPLCDGCRGKENLRGVWPLVVFSSSRGPSHTYVQH